jgi:F-type H+-transporting ATPase subunit epsilon
MTLTTHLDIVSAEALIFSGPVIQAIVPAEAGEICILARHAPLLTHLRPGLLRFTTQFDGAHTFFVTTGFLEVQPHSVTVLADTVLRTRDFDEAAARTAVERTRKAIAARPSAVDYERLVTELKMEMALLRAIDGLRRQTKR